MKTQLEKFVESRIESLEKRRDALYKRLNFIPANDIVAVNDALKDIENIDRHISDLRTCSTLEVKSK